MKQAESLPTVRKHGALRCALICFLCAFASFAPFLFRDGGFFHVWSDFSWQQVPFGIALHNFLAERNPGGWIWNYGLGISAVQAFSFYVMGSPFYWLSLPFPAEWYPVMVGWIYLLKYTAAGVTAYCYIRRFVRGESAAVAGALMYAFSGFQTVNLMFYHFHDVVALFPLLLTGIEQVLEDPKNRGLMIFAAFINALTNYYFFVIEVVFSILYFLFRFFGRQERSLKLFLRNAGSCLLCGAWGAAMAGVLLVPSLLYVLKSPRTGITLHLGDLFRDSRWVLSVLRNLVLPGDTMRFMAGFYEADYSSSAAWLPMAGMGLCLACLWKNRQERKSGWLAGLLLLLICLAFSPLVSSGFLLFSEPTGRWFFVLTLMGALASARVLDDADAYPVRKSLVTYFVLLLLFCAAVYRLPYDNQTPAMITNKSRFLLFSGIGLGGTALLLILHRFGKLRSRAAVALVFLFAAGSTFLTLNNYYGYTGDGTSRNSLETGMQLEAHDEQYRYNLTNNQLMIPGHGSGMNVFSSTVSPAEREFDKSLFGYYSMNHNLNKNSIPGLRELFAGKYYLSRNKGEASPLQEIEENGGVRYVLERDACPIGFSVDHYILREELLKLDEEHRGTALLEAAVILPWEEATLSELCTPLSAGDLSAEADLTGLVRRNLENSVTDFHRDSRGFRCVSEYSTPKFVYFSVPNDGGWTAFVDDVKQEILPSAGMMLLRVPEGRHDIEFTYVTPGFTVGLILSAVSAAALALYLLLRKIRKC